MRSRRFGDGSRRGRGGRGTWWAPSQVDVRPGDGEGMGSRLDVVVLFRMSGNYV